MPSIPFTSSGFTLNRATAASRQTVVATFSYPPYLSTVGYTVTVGSSAFVVVSATYGETTQDVVLGLASAMPNGAGTLTVSTAIISGGVPVTAGSVPFTVSFAADFTDNVGLSNPTALSVLRQNFPEGFSGTYWEALLAALATGDQPNYDSSRSTFDQAFLHTATGKYLDQRAAERGIKRPDDFMSDERFRNLAEVLDYERLTEPAIWAILEVLYGGAMTRAYAYQDVTNPSVVLGGDTLTLRLDGVRDIEVTVSASDFSGTPTYEELAALINRVMVQEEYDGYAEVVNYPDTTAQELRVYSEILGYGGSVEILAKVAGQAGNSFFNGDSVEYGSAGYAWTFTKNLDGTMTMSGSAFKEVLEGDHLVLQDEFGANAGAFNITSVDLRLSSGGTSTVSFVNPTGTSGTTTQATNFSAALYRAKVYHFGRYSTTTTTPYPMFASVSYGANTTNILELKLPNLPIIEGPGGILDTVEPFIVEDNSVTWALKASLGTTVTAVLAGKHDGVPLRLSGTTPSSPFWAVFGDTVGPVLCTPTVTAGFVTADPGFTFPYIPAGTSAFEVSLDGTVGDGLVVADPAAMTQSIVTLLDSVVAVGNDYRVTINESWGG